MTFRISYSITRATKPSRFWPNTAIKHGNIAKTSSLLSLSSKFIKNTARIISLDVKFNELSKIFWCHTYHGWNEVVSEIITIVMIHRSFVTIHCNPIQHNNTQFYVRFLFLGHKIINYKLLRGTLTPLRTNDARSVTVLITLEFMNYSNF